MRALPLLLLAGCVTESSYARRFAQAHCANLEDCGYLGDDTVDACEAATEEWLVELSETDTCEFDKEVARETLDAADEAACLDAGSWDYLLDLVTLDELVSYTGAAVYTCPASSADDLWARFELLFGDLAG